MDRKNFGSYPKKDLYFMGWEERFMNLFSQIKREWKSAGIIERASWIIGFGVPLMSAILWSIGFITQSNVFILFSLIFFLLSLIVIFLNISMRHARDNAKQMLVEEKHLHKIEVSEWVGRCEKLSQSLGHYLERERSKFQQEAADLSPKTVMKPVEAHMLLMPTFPGEQAYCEINQTLREYREESE